MALIITGFLSGIIGGMGIGGGTILIPIMTIFLGFDQKTAQAVNLIYFIPTAITALTIHIKNKQIEKNNLWLLIVFGIIGTRTCMREGFTWKTQPDGLTRSTTKQK